MTALDFSNLTPLSGAGAPPSGGLDFSSLTPVDQAKPATTPDRTPSIGDVGSQYGYGLLSGIPNAAASMMNAQERGRQMGAFMPGVDILAGTIAPLIPGAPQPSPTSVQPGNALKSAMGSVGLNPDNLPQPQSGPERLARMAGEGTSLAVAPELAMGRAASVANAVRAGLTGAASGLGAQAGVEVAPDNLKPLAGLAGGLAGGVGADVAASAAAKAAEGAGRFTAPFTQAGREGIAAQKLASAATDPQAAIDAVGNAPNEIVPGSRPTTFQQTGDLGLGGLERAVATQNPEAFAARRGEQNAVRLDALGNIQAEGHPEAVSDFFRSQLSDIDQQTQSAYDTASQQARTAADNIGGDQNAAQTGEQLRMALQQNLDDAKARESALWKAVDPTNSLQVLTSPLKRAVGDVYGNMGPAAKIGLSPVENDFQQVIGSYGTTIPFNELTDLRSQISSAMRQAKSPLQPNDVAYGRLSQLRGAIEDAISDSVEGKSAQEQQAVAAGQLSPDETTLARWQNEVQGILDAKRAMGRSSGTGATPVQGGPGAIPDQDRTAGTQGSEPSGVTGDQEGQGPLVDQATAERLNTATVATKERKQTFGTKPVSSILQREGATYPYKMPAENVAAQVWKKGPEGAASVNAVLKAGNNAPEALNAVQAGAASSLKGAALRDDGTLDPKKFAGWKAAHGEALNALEKASPGTSAAYETAAKAAEHLGDVARQRQDAVKSYEKSALGKLLKIDDPDDVVKSIGSIFARKDAVKNMKEIATEARKDPAAFEGLRRAIVEHAEQKLISNTEAGTSGRNLLKSDSFQSFVGKNHQALRQVFTDDELNAWTAIAQDLKRANRSVTGVKLPGQSNTAQDLAAVAKHGSGPSLLHLAAHVLQRSLLPGLGFLAEGPAGFAVGLAANYAGHLVGSLRAAGISQIDDLMRDAMLNPQLAKTLLMKAPKKPETGAMVTLSRYLRNIAIPTLNVTGAQ